MGRSGIKQKISTCLPVAATLNCCDNSGGKALYIVSVTMIGARLNRLPSASIGESFLASVKKGTQSLERRLCQLSLSDKEKHTEEEKVISSILKTTCCYCQHQRRNERFCHHWSNCQGIS